MNLPTQETTKHPNPLPTPIQTPIIESIVSIHLRSFRFRSLARFAPFSPLRPRHGTLGRPRGRPAGVLADLRGASGDQPRATRGAWPGTDAEDVVLGVLGVLGVDDGRAAGSDLWKLG